MKNVFVPTDNVARFTSAMRILEDTRKGQPGLAVVYGRAGRGKTVAATSWYAERGGFFLRVWQDWTQFSFLQALCFEVAGERPHGAHQCKTRICEALGRREGQPRTIYVDEADRLHPGRIEDLRDIHDVTGCPVVLIGEEQLYPSLGAKRRIWSRVTQRVEFGPVKDEDVLVFASQAADLRLTPEAASLVAKKAEGDFRTVYRLVQELERMAQAAQSSDITADHARRLNGVR